MKRLKKLWFLILTSALLQVPATAQEVRARRQPNPAQWSDHYNVSGFSSTAQGVCDARAAVLGYPAGYFFFAMDSGVSHRGSCVGPPVWNPWIAARPFLGQQCPDKYSIYNSLEVNVDVYFGPDQYCESTWPVVDRSHDNPQAGQQACAGNPIFPLTGAKRQSETLLRWSATLPPLSIGYDNRRMLPNADPQGAFLPVPSPSFGLLWESSLHKRLVVQQGGSPGYYRNAQVSRGLGVWVSFYRDVANPNLAPDGDISDRLVSLANSWRFVDANAQTQEIYNSSGVIQTVAFARGDSLTYFYSDSTTPVSVAPVAGLLVKVQDQFGRAVQFEYEQPSAAAIPRVARIVDPDGGPVQVAYGSSGNLDRLTWSDAQIRQFVYEQSTLPWALTGIIDENNERHSTYSYDAEGRARSTEHAGGVNRYSVNYSSPPRWVTTESFDSANAMFWRDHNWQAPQDAVMTTPNGTSVALDATLVNGMPRLTTRSQPAGAGCDASTSRLTYDANGNVASKIDFNGAKSCYAHDLSRNLETARSDGLGAADACPVDLGASTITAEASQRKSTTQWHPAWNLPIKQAEPKKITISVYNGQPDPTAGNATVSCAPATALLPDGSPIAVLCKKVEQATADATGSLGFNATATGTPRTWSYTYNQYGQTLTARDPLNKLTAYAYYSDTTDLHTMGDLQSVTDSTSRVTQYTRYDKSGRLMQSVDVNGTVTDTTYTPRGWVKTVTVKPPSAAAQLSVYDYDGVGQLKKATLPDGSALEYAYDAAHRLTSIKDTAGNAVTYTLDNMGNRAAEDLKDPSGTLARNITRVYDALNRAQSFTGMAQ